MGKQLANASQARRDSSVAGDIGYSEDEIEALLVEVTRLAKQFARELVKRRVAEDLAQDVVLECLTAIRGGRWSRRGAALPAIVANLVRRRAVDGLRSRQRAEKREAEFARELLENSRAWMAPDGELEERELAEMRERALASLPPACRRAYLLVRDQGMSYQEAARILGVSRSGISAFVVKAQRKLRGELASCGIEATRWRRRRFARGPHDGRDSSS
jgi:RNA polymerase sigma-70 factor (ECF subfamily)